MNNVRIGLETHSVAAYFVLTLAINWTVAIPLALAAQGVLDLQLPFGMHYLASLGPITAAVVVTLLVASTLGLAQLLAHAARWRRLALVACCGGIARSPIRGCDSRCASNGGFMAGPESRG
jgi:hypothetical protein